ncbi:hypothetical protein LCGC14_0853020 [marine sediment metagenome]|uniref:Uncharacterized protein n=1 Tax=marine sediment metagenome TaxID=412755 RepID=A0A0F9PUZ4_9ZZZZ
MGNKPIARAPRAISLKRQALVGQLWLRGYSERAIAELVRTEAAKATSELHGCEKTTHVTVHYDVEANRKRWLKQMTDPVDRKRSDQVARLLDIQHQAWADFSRTPIISAFARGSFLRIALEAEEKLAKILGTLAPVKLTGGEGEPLIPPIVEFHFPDGTVMKPPRNGHVLEEAEAIVKEYDGNGDRPAED